MTLYVINASFSSGKVWLALNLNQGCCGVTAPRVLSYLGQLHLHFAGLPETGWDRHHHMYLRSWDRWSRLYKTWVVKTVTCVVCIQTGKSTLCVSEHKERRREFPFSVCRTLMLWHVVSVILFQTSLSLVGESSQISGIHMQFAGCAESQKWLCNVCSESVGGEVERACWQLWVHTCTPPYPEHTRPCVFSTVSSLGWEQLCHKRSIASFLLNVCLVTVISLGVVKKIQRHFARMHATISYFRKRHLDTFGIFVSDKALPKKYKTKQKPSK